MSIQSGFQGSQVLGVIPVPPLQHVDTPTAKRQLEAFQAEARGILEEANIADDLSAPLAVAAAEAENLTLSKLGTAHTPYRAPSWAYAFVMKNLFLLVSLRR